MTGTSKIEWTEATWNPIVGCSIHSPGCANCYAMRMAHRLSHNPATPHYAGTTKLVKGKPVFTGQTGLAPEATLLAPLRWKKPRTIFVNSMGDLFHESVPDEAIDKVFAVMALTPQHTYQVLTKRSARMREYLSRPETPFRRIHHAAAGCVDAYATWGWCHSRTMAATPYNLYLQAPWPLPNVWLGVSTERQQEADERIPDLLQTPAAARFISAEPLLGPLDLRAVPYADGKRLDAVSGGRFRDGEWWGVGRTLDWVIAGGESGHGARPMHPDWARSLRDQCAAANVPFFFKQWGEWLPGEANCGQFDPTPMHAYRRCDDHSYDWPRHSRTENFGTHQDRFSGSFTAKRVGKAAAGRLLDGRTHDDMPVAREVAFT